MNRIPVFFVLAFFAISAGAVFAQAPAAPPASEYFPFVIPWSDSRTSVTDMSSLNKPIEPVVARDGHFYGAKTGMRIRFIGVSILGTECFPTQADARAVAAHMAKYGINLVRLHALDNDWDAQSSLLNLKPGTSGRFSKTQLDKLDYLVAQLEKHGVYVDVNLHVAHSFSASEGLPASVAMLTQEYCKRVDEFDKTMIALQRQYAHDLLTHVNPYTGKSFAKDPGVAMVEINNEDSLVGDPLATVGGDLDKLPEPFHGELIGLWDAWLRRKYGSDDALKAAWLTGITPAGPSMMNQNKMWLLERRDTDADMFANIGKDPNVAPDPTIDVHKTDGVNWHVMAKIGRLNFNNGDSYTVRFRAKAESPRTITLAAGVEGGDYHSIGLQVGVDLTSDWQTYMYSFAAKGIEPGSNRIMFEVGAQSGRVEIADFMVVPGNSLGGLRDGQSLGGTVPAPQSGRTTAAQVEDWNMFLADTEKSYLDSMRVYLKSGLGVRAPVTGSQMGYGALTSVHNESGMDYCDNHAYWQHPKFPGKPWDPEVWTIDNTSMVSAMMAGDPGTLLSLASYRVAGKPYTVSEYNHPAPSDYQAECVPVIMSFAAAQDWDAVMLFDYGAYGAGQDTMRFDNYFDTATDPAKMAFLPSAAAMFRLGLITPLPRAETAYMPLEGPNRGRYVTLPDLWPDPADFLHARVRVQTVAGQAPVFAGPRGKETGLKMYGPDAVYIAATVGAQAVAGVVGGHTVTVGPATYDFPVFGNNYAAFTLASMDSAAIPKSRRLLFTLIGRVENQEMGWNGDRTSVGDKWGHGPVRAEAIPCTVTITMNGPGKVVALDPTGNPKAVVSSTYGAGKLTFSTGKNGTVWYAILPK